MYHHCGVAGSDMYRHCGVTGSDMYHHCGVTGTVTCIVTVGLLVP